jgi:hypothetical protein
MLMQYVLVPVVLGVGAKLLVDSLCPTSAVGIASTACSPYIEALLDVPGHIS